MLDIPIGKALAAREQKKSGYELDARVVFCSETLNVLILFAVQMNAKTTRT